MRNMLLLACLLGSVLLSAQVKYEREYRIGAEAVPASVLAYVEGFGFTRKLKWYREEGLNRQSIEVKTKYLGACYSLEFSENGLVEDIEVKTPFSTLPAKVQDRIQATLANIFEDYTIRKTQIQYTGTAADLSTLLMDTKAELMVHYELVAKVKGSNGRLLQELLFDPSGRLLRQSTILFRNTDNLEF